MQCDIPHLRRRGIIHHEATSNQSSPHCLERLLLRYLHSGFLLLCTTPAIGKNPVYCERQIGTHIETDTAGSMPSAQVQCQIPLFFGWQNLSAGRHLSDHKKFGYSSLRNTDMSYTPNLGNVIHAKKCHVQIAKRIPCSLRFLESY